MSAERRTRLTFDVESLSAIEDALSYYLSASRNNWGAGWSGEDPDDRETLMAERGAVGAVLGRLTAARRRLEADTR